MFLSNFSIKQPVTTVAIIIVLMCLGLLALKNLRVNQIPDVEQPVMVGQLPVSGRLARDGGARDHQSRREVAAEHSAGLRDLLDGLGEQRAVRHHLRLQEGHVGGRRRDPQRDRLGALQAADRDARAGAVARRSGRGADHATWRCHRPRRSHAEISRLAEDVLADRFRGIDGVSRGQRQRRAASRAVGAAARAEAARVQRLGRRGRERAARAEHHRARRPRQGRRWTSRTSASSAASSRPAEFNDIVVQAPGQRDRAPGPGGHRRGRLRRAEQLQPAQRPAQRRPVDHPLARGEHGHGGRASAQGGRGDQQDAARGHEARDHARWRRGRRSRA